MVRYILNLRSDDTCLQTELPSRSYARTGDTSQTAPILQPVCHGPHRFAFEKRNKVTRQVQLELLSRCVYQPIRSIIVNFSSLTGRIESLPVFIRSFAELELEREKAATPTLEMNELNQSDGINESMSSGYDGDIDEFETNGNWYSVTLGINCNFFSC